VLFTLIEGIRTERERREMPRKKLDKILAGSAVGEWTVLRKAVRSSYWICECSCGETREVREDSLKARDSLYCIRCKARKNRAQATPKHGRTGTAEYRVWDAMIQRCTNSRTKAYKNYGGRGITVCYRWRFSFEAFCKDMGERPSDTHTIDRIDNDRGYFQGNCRWATRSEQSRNHRRNHWVLFQGKVRTVTDWARHLGIPPGLIFYRLKRNWPIEKVLSIVRFKKNGEEKTR